MRGIVIPPKVVRRGSYLLLGAILLLPLAAGADVTGEFLVEGRVTLPAGADLEGAPLLGLLRGANETRNVTLEAASARIHFLELRMAEPPVLRERAPGIQVDEDHQWVDVRDLRMEMTPSRDGYLGFYAGEGATLQLTASSSAGLEGKARSVITSLVAGGISGGPFETREYYQQIATGPHVLNSAAGELWYRGPGTLKVFGPDVQWSAAQGGGALSTGELDGSGLDTHETVRWVVVEFADGTFHAESPSPWVLATRDVSASWSGTTYFVPTTGEMSAGSSRYLASGSAARVGGALSGSFSPIPSAGDDVKLGMSLSGDLASTSMRPQTVAPAPAGSSDRAWLPILGVALATCVAGFSGGLLLRRSRVRSARVVAAPAAAAVPESLPFTAEDCCDAGAKAASEEDWAEAAKWFRRAHRLAPTSARICADLAFSLSQIGDVDEALVLFREASRLSSDGEADFNGALAALQAGRPAEEVEEWLDRALARTPGLVLPLEADNDFHLLAGRPRFEAALRRAREHVSGRARGSGDAGRYGA